MSISPGTAPIRRIARVAIALGGGYLPGLGALVCACAQAARRQGWAVVGIRDGFDGLLSPERFAEGGVVAIPEAVDTDGGSLLGTGARLDPFRLPQIDGDGLVTEVDASVRLLDALRAQGIDALIGIVGGSAVTGAHALAVSWKLARLGLRCVCIPKSAENDFAATRMPYGYDSVRRYASEALRHIGIAARDQGRVAVVEVPGRYAGWLALESGIAAGADAVLIPERPYDAEVVARHLDACAAPGLVVVADGAHATGQVPASAELAPRLQVIERSGITAQAVRQALQRHSRRELYAFAFDQLVRAGAVGDADVALAARYASAAVSALATGQTQHLVAAQAQDCALVPLAEAVNRIRTVDAEALAAARARPVLGGSCMSGTSTADEDVRGVVVNLQHFSTHDGPGIRTTVFLKGCSLRCAWCCNPETIAPKPELAYKLNQCIGVEACGRCLPVCPEQALHRLDSDGKVRVNWDLCSHCGKCVDVCPSQALSLFGRTMRVAEVLAEVEQDGDFYAESGGGITLSGGECLMQPDFAAALLRAARARGLHTAIETAGNVPWRFFEQVLPHVDTMLHDYKLSDPAAHRQWAGTENARILENFQRAYARFPTIDFIARIPLIAGLNDDEAHIDAVLAAILPWPNVSELELLPYHRYGGSKYGFIGRAPAQDRFAAPAPEHLAQLRAHIAARFAARQAGR